MDFSKLLLFIYKSKHCSDKTLSDKIPLLFPYNSHNINNPSSNPTEVCYHTFPSNHTADAVQSFRKLDMHSFYNLPILEETQWSYKVLLKQYFKFSADQ